MILERFYDDDLAQASYLIGCGASGEALVIDPNRDVDQYVRAAERNALRIAHVAETHIHADFVSGLRELAARTGAQPSLSDEGDAAWRYRFAADDGAVPLHDGETIHVGAVRLDVLHSPGHTPEHVCFVVTDTAVGDRPVGVFTGDFVFAGDVGRPDLLERVAGERDRSEAAARHLFRSLQSFKQFPDYLQLWPGHGAGSACGRSLGAIPQTTLGYEKMFNWALQHEDEDAFTREVLADQPEPPKYFAEMKRINRDGPRVLGGFERPPRLAPERLAALLPVPDAELRLPDPVAPGVLVIDTRSAAEHAAARVPGTVNIPLDRSFNTWAGWLIPYDRDFYLIVNDAGCPACIDEAVRDLAMIGLERIAGWFGVDAIDAWRASGQPLESIAEITPRRLYERLQAGDVTVVDVRSPSEWESGHLPGVPNVPLGELIDRLDRLPRDRPVIVHCQSGSRSAIAASILRSNRFDDVTDMRGGFGAWRHQKLPIETRGGPPHEHSAPPAG